LDKGILTNIFCHKFYGFNKFISFFNFKYGIIGTKGYPTLTYLSFKKKKNRKYKGIDIYLIPGNDTLYYLLYDFQSYNNKLFILERTKLLILNISFQ